jgi:hypothetical protein
MICDAITHLKHAQLGHFIPQILALLQLQVLCQAAKLLQESHQVVPVSVPWLPAFQCRKQLQHNSIHNTRHSSK